MRTLVFVVAFTLVACSSGNDLSGQFTPQPVIAGDDDDVVGVDVSTWFERESGLPHALNDVHWNGWQFLAVGDGGTIMTSPDGIDWTHQVSGTDVNLNAIGWDGYDFIVVGDSATILFSNGGENWMTQFDGPDNISLQAVIHYAWPVIAAGKALDTDAAFMMTSMDHGISWTVINSLPQSGRSISDIAKSGGLFTGEFVATTQIEVFPNDGRILTSADGLTWVEVAISTEAISTLSILKDDKQFWVGGTEGRIYSSPDGVNWTEYQTPAFMSSLSGIASSELTLIAHGSNDFFNWGDQIGVSTSDEGESWQTFNIGTSYESRGLAYADGRFVSVGRTIPAPGQGAIFTTP